ncbi:olfactory receptor 4Q2-like [Silurus meridionalis]|uniref:olfactory receptor 4Q2-like n=1 Tax=Silurus meridionalis TaxID=175797 RepID=UPI001EEB5BE0|nr:olfactory receptor 4Q2-like [Silurus meridionalis]
MYGPDEPSDSETIIPPALILGPIVWDIDREIRTASLHEVTWVLSSRLGSGERSSNSWESHQDQGEWCRFLPWAEYAQNSLRQDMTGLTPFQCVLGFQPPLFPWSDEPSNVPAVDYWFRESSRIWESMTSNTETLNKNYTSNIPDIVLQGFTGIPDVYNGLVGTFFFFIYLMLASGNIFILVFVACEKSLQKPTYIIFCNLALSDLGFGTTTLPRIMARYWMSQKIMSFNACLTQMFFVHYFGACSSFLMALMALDRFVAICNPLRYPVLIKNSTIAILCSVLWIGNLVQLCVIVLLTLSVPYCGPNIINRCYCDFSSITNLACADITVIKTISTSIAMTVLWGPLFYIIFSYVAIIISVMKISNKEGRYKTFLTCTPQLLIICLYYLPRSFVYVAFVIGFHFETNLRVALVMMYSLFPTLINPLIYCFRTKVIKDTLLRKYKQRQTRVK